MVPVKRLLLGQGHMKDFTEPSTLFRHMGPCLSFLSSAQGVLAQGFARGKGKRESEEGGWMDAGGERLADSSSKDPALQSPK